MASLRCDPSERFDWGTHLPICSVRAVTQAIGEKLDDEWNAWESDAPYLSVVVAARNEAASLTQLIDELTAALRPLCSGGEHGLCGYEILVVDDASTDETRSILRQLAAAYPELKGLTLVTRGGQSAATVAGIRAARGSWIATMDADLQNDPADLTQLWRAVCGQDAALGWRVARQDVWWKRLISRWANRIRNAVLGQSIRDTGCSLRIFRRELALRLPAFHGVHRFLGPLLLREGCRLVQVPVHDRPRLHGRSHYRLWSRSIRVAIDLLGVAWLLRRPICSQPVTIWESRGAGGSQDSDAGPVVSEGWGREG
jgi:glycosyltransferase involved in cell wall biosynthesis